MKHYLVVANRTLGGRRLRAQINELSQDGPCHFHVLVPANRPSGPADKAVDDGDATFPGGPDAVHVAEQKLEMELDRLRAMGVSASGEVADPDPITAVAQALKERDVDAILLSTPPSGPSSWLHLDLPSRVERAAEVPVTTITEE